MKQPYKHWVLLGILLYGELPNSQREGNQIEIRTGTLARKLRTTNDRVITEYLPLLKKLGAIESFSRPDWGKVIITLGNPPHINLCLTNECKCGIIKTMG